ncbi:MAG: hypothetical protein H6Q05_3042 [Acidobacteria bacterium]|nr:hypothetical protein [Acidobacteriota bacterium]
MGTNPAVRQRSDNDENHEIHEMHERDFASEWI